MDKYDLVLDIVEHPEKYTSEQLTELLSEPETREIYNLLCKTESAITADNTPDVNAEWVYFFGNHAVRPRNIFSWFGSRAASIVAIVGTSIVAVAAGIAVTVSVIDHKPELTAEEEPVIPSVMTVASDTLTDRKDTVNVSLNSVMFENESLEKIMNEVSKAYRVEVKFTSVKTASLHLYYKFDPSLSLDEVIEQLNTFERINIRRNGNTLTID